jgi:hypothetical protein
MNYVPALIIGVLIGATALYLFLRRKPNREKQIIDDSPGRNSNPAFAVDSVFDVASAKVVPNQPGQNRHFTSQISAGRLKELLAPERSELYFCFTNDDTRRPRNSYFSAFVRPDVTDAVRTGKMEGVADFTVLERPFPKLFPNGEATLGSLMLTASALEAIRKTVPQEKQQAIVGFRVEPTQNSPLSADGYFVDGSGNTVGEKMALQPCPPYKPSDR